MTGSQVDLILKIVAALIPATAGVIALLTGPGARRGKLKTDSEILKNLEPGSKAHDDVSWVVERQAASLVSFERGERAVGQAVTATVFAAVFGFLTFLAASAGGWWWIAAGLAGLTSVACVVVTFDFSRRVERDGDGNPKVDE